MISPGVPCHVLWKPSLKFDISAVFFPQQNSKQAREGFNTVQDLDHLENSADVILHLTSFSVSRTTPTFSMGISVQKKN